MSSAVAEAPAGLAPPPSPQRIVSRLSHATFGLWFPAFQGLAVSMRPEWLGRLGSATVERVIWNREPVREALLDNFSAVLGLPRTHRRVEETALSMLSHHSRLWIDFLRYSSRPPVPASSLVTQQVGTERLVSLHGTGRGAILLTAHVGNFEVGGILLREIGLDLGVVYQKDPSPVVERHRAEARVRIGVKSFPVTTTLSFVPVLRALEEGTFVAIQGDRDYSGTGKRLPFFGRSASFPVGPFKLAAAAGVPLLPVFVLRGADGKYRTVVEEPIRVASPAGRAARQAAELAALERFVGVLERTIREVPDQWYCFSRFWEAMG